MTGIAVNQYGNVDLYHDDCPEGHVYYPDARSTTCKSLGIPYARAVVDFEHWGVSNSAPRYKGVVILERDAPKLNQRLAKLKAKKDKKKKLSLTVDNIAAALHTVNKAAKNRRDAAESAYWGGQKGLASHHASEKRSYYAIKDFTIDKAIRNDIATFAGYHSSDGDNAKLFFESWIIGQYSFHRPIDYGEIPDRSPVFHLGPWLSPRRPKLEMTVTDAWDLLVNFLWPI